MPSRPGGKLASRPLQFFWVADCSGSMAGEKIDSLNTAVRDALPEMRRVARENPNAQLYVNVLAFSTGTRWIATQTPVEQFQWQDLRVGGTTDMGAALREVASRLSVPPMDERGLTPVVVLVSDGQPTDDFKAGLAAFMSKPWGQKAIRLAIAIGRDCDKDVLQQFIAHSELAPLQANNSDDLVRYIRWASTVAVQNASKQHVQANDPGTNNNIVHLAQNAPEPSGNTVW